MEATSKQEIIDKLHKMGYMTTQVIEAIPGIKIETIFDKLRRVSTEDMIMFNVQFANMIGAGINILSSLLTMAKQIENKRLKETIGDIARNIEAGDSLSSALTRHPGIFSKLFLNMVKAGEASGKLPAVLNSFAKFSEHQADLRQKIKGALFYPIILLFAGIAVTLFIIAFIIPQFAEIFLKTGIRLPLVTLILYKIGITIKHFWFSFILLFIVIVLGVRYYAQTERARFLIDRVKLRLPILGPLYRKAAISRFSRTLATLVASGVPILQSLDMVKEVIGNEVLAQVVGNVRNSVERGQSISQTLKISEEFPADAVQMISVGEETGNLDVMLNKISDFYDMSLGYTIKTLTTVLEPLLLVIMGCMVGFIMASMLLPIFDMIKILRR
jgi:type IV pilus assembly protein PilC